ncbi:multidrug effflux MFS transporter [Caenispirillum bisanense]|uniref:Bcr/CflA family efflux transporter n=1 Tax=Caenispirillum bisanense TaxID=414052 RepID=A0A286GUA3_9PROT|nr:multidrug effflux MFS transporter [Caenispirillum bisanense]SOD99088.1 MFS transporter, DHA1 family, bicyclomycin/chloramphenicol resistance protein [Caenispirillum bisanense]
MSAAKFDPRSFPVAVLLTALVAFGPMSTDLYLPSLPDMTRAFDTSVSMVQLTLSVFAAGFAFGMLVYGPLSDRFGRRPLLIGGAALYVAASVVCMVAPSIEALLVGRFLQAIGACAGPVIGRAVVRDVYDRTEAARMLSYMASAMALAPAVAPMIGGALHAGFGWRANFVALTVFGIAVTVATWAMLRETNAHRDPLATRPSRLAANFGYLLKSRVFMGHTLCVALGFAGLFSFISGSSFVVIDVLGVDPQYFGFAFMAVVVGYITGAFGGGRLSGRLGIERLLAFGSLVAALAGVAAAGLAWAGVETVVAVILPVSIYFFGAAVLMPNGTAGAISPFPRMAGTASSLLGFLQMGAGALTGWLVGLLHDGTTRVMTTSMALCGVAALLCFVLLVRGGGHRAEAAAAE